MENGNTKETALVRLVVSATLGFIVGFLLVSCGGGSSSSTKGGVLIDNPCNVVKSDSSTLTIRCADGITLITPIDGDANVNGTERNDNDRDNNNSTGNSGNDDSQDDGSNVDADSGVGEDDESDSSPDDDTNKPPTGAVKVQVCHKGKVNLLLPAAALSAHVNHGDTIGGCDG